MGDLKIISRIQNEFVIPPPPPNTRNNFKNEATDPFLTGFGRYPDTEVPIIHSWHVIVLLHLHTVWKTYKKIKNQEGVPHSKIRNIHKLITSPQEADEWAKPYMVNYQGQYTNIAVNIRINLPYCVLSEVCIYTIYTFHATFSPPSKGRRR